MTTEEAIAHVVDTFDLAGHIYDVRSHFCETDYDDVEDEIPDDLKDACKAWYDDDQANSWDHPMVILFGQVCETLKSSIPETP